MLRAMSAVIAAGWIAWQVHASQPPVNPVHDVEFDRNIKDIHEDLKRIEGKVNRLIQQR